jgi:hypothetical protein
MSNLAQSLYGLVEMGTRLKQPLIFEEGKIKLGDWTYIVTHEHFDEAVFYALILFIKLEAKKEILEKVNT